MLIRKARLEDLPQIGELLATTWHATYDAIYGAERVADITARWHAPAALMAQLDDPAARFTVADLDGTLVATALGRHCADGAITISRLYVLPDYQGRGIGLVLLRDLLAMAAGAPRAIVEVEPANTAAIRFYKSREFRITGRSGDCGGTGDNIPHLIMERDLKPTLGADDGG